MPLAIPFPRYILIFLGVIGALLFVQALFPPIPKPMSMQDLAEEDCDGEALPVPFEYTGSVNEPWSCQVQCQDKKQRYLVYTNGVATQCEQLPGCNDWGEDRRITCRIPGGASIAPASVMSTQNSQASSK